MLDKLHVTESLSLDYDVYAHHALNLIASYDEERLARLPVSLPPPEVVVPTIDSAELYSLISSTESSNLTPTIDKPDATAVQIDQVNKIFLSALLSTNRVDFGFPLALALAEALGKKLVENNRNETIEEVEAAANELAREVSGILRDYQLRVNVGILGAGASGLYTALIFDDLGIPYHILEARDRVGGRLYTHKFSDPTAAPYNYFDIGAMRFPKISSTRRLFHLFQYEPLNTGGNFDLSSRLRKYYLRNDNTFLSYNGITVRRANNPTAQTFKPHDLITDIPLDDAVKYIAVGPDAIVNDVVAPYAEALLDDLKFADRKEGWKKLMSVDQHSMRSFMLTQYKPYKLTGLPKNSLSTDVINWCETFGGSTGAFDRSFSDTVLGRVAFGWSPNAEARIDWKCINEGGYEIARVMADYIRSKKPSSITLNDRVTRIAMGQNGGVDVSTSNTISGSPRVKHFAHVISTLPLPVLRIVDLEKAQLTIPQRNAIRNLNYGNAVKIGMQFKTAWWFRDPLKIVGGQSSTDTPLRNIVYPSFGEADKGKTTTLIASYSWTDDAVRLGALMGSSLDDKVLKGIVIRELAKIHSVTEEFLWSDLIGFHAYNWAADPYAMGPYAFFGPGKYKKFYASLTAPAGGLLHFAGDAISPRHGWVEGALDSAWRSVCEMLLSGPEFLRLPPLEYLIIWTKFVVHWGFNREWTKPGTRPLVKAPLESGKDGQGGEGRVETVLWEETLILKHLQVELSDCGR